MKNRPLQVEIVDDELRISIGIETLKFAAENSPHPKLTIYDVHEAKYFFNPIKDIEKFAEDVKYTLLQEKEDGETLVHILLEQAFINTLENGSEGVEYYNWQESKYY